MAKWNTNWFNFPGLMLMIIMLMMSGCATSFLGGYGANGQTQEEFTRYVERVFKLQNNLTSEIMSLPETDDTKNHDAILAAEQHMQEACAPLNEYASRESEDLNIGLFLRRRVEKSAADCEQAALKVNSLLGH
jgi:hypothetical protein